MESADLTTQELEEIKIMCEAVSRTGINWPLAVSSFPPRNEYERIWKEKMLKGIRLASPQALKG